STDLDVRAVTDYFLDGETQAPRQTAFVQALRNARLLSRRLRMDGTSQAIVRGGSVRRETSRPLCAITGLGKSYDGQLAIVDISFDVQPGEILGVIGPNGAGKTTLLETLAGLIAGDAGEVRWRGHPIPVSP